MKEVLYGGPAGYVVNPAAVRGGLALLGDARIDDLLLVARTRLDDDAWS